MGQKSHPCPTFIGDKKVDRIRTLPQRIGTVFHASFKFWSSLLLLDPASLLGNERRLCVRLEKHELWHCLPATLAACHKGEPCLNRGQGYLAILGLCLKASNKVEVPQRNADKTGSGEGEKGGTLNLS